MKRCIGVVLFLAAGGLLAADRVWQAAGDGDWSDPANWVGGTLPGASDTAVFNNALSADATVNMDGGAPLIGKIRVDNPDNAHTRVFAGTQAVLSNEFVKGRAELRGMWSSNQKAITSVGQLAGQTAWLTLSGDAAFVATNQHALYIGNVNNARGRVMVKDNARLSLSTADTDNGLSIGRSTGSVGSFLQEGGVVEAVGRFMPGYNGYGAYEMLGGRLVLPYGAGNTRYRLAVQANSTGLFYQRGGELTAAANGKNGDFFFEIGSGNNNAAGIYYADGGVARVGIEIRLMASTGNVNSPSYNELSISGAGVVETPERVYLRSNNLTYGGDSMLNLNRGGLLKTFNLLLGMPPSGSGASFLNFDGGTLELTNTNELSTFLSTVTNIRLYEGGMNLRLSGTGVRATGVLRGPGGWGVASVTVTGGGSGYLAPPRVTVTGGSGSNAAAVAFIDHVTGAVTGAVVTCRGEGYGESDTLALTISGGGGSGATATAVLTENRTGPLVKSGPSRLRVDDQPEFDGEYVVREGVFMQSANGASVGSPNVSAVRVSGDGAVLQVGNSGTGLAGITNNVPSLWNLINPSVSLYLGGDFGGGEFILPCGAEDTVFRQAFNSLELGIGHSRLNTASQNATNGAAMIFGSVSRPPGAAVRMTTITNLTVTVNGDVSSIAFGAGRPVLAGVHFGDQPVLMTLDEAGRWKALEGYDEGFGAESNHWVGVAATAEGLAVNSLSLADGAELTLQAEGVTVVGSGMVVATNGAAGGTRVAGGTLTSGNGADLILFDAHNLLERRNVAPAMTGLAVDARITDNGAVPVALFALGRMWSADLHTIQGGPAVALTRGDNIYSGGTYITDTLLSVAADGSLGAVPAVPTNNIVSSGMALLRAPVDDVTVTLHPNRHIRICGGGLTLIGDTNSQPGREFFHVPGNIGGKGVLVLNHWTGAGVRSAVRLSGDNRAFEGAVAVHGLLRCTGGHSLPPKANLLLCDKGTVTTGGGILETAGAFTRAPGSGAGQVLWGEVNSVAPGYAKDNSGANGGGFSAYGGPLTVNLGGDRRRLTLGQDGFAPARLRLQSDYATDLLTWENPVDVTNGTLNVQVAYNATDKTAVWRGAVTSSSPDGGGAFTKIGNGKLRLADGADFGPVIFNANNTVELFVTNRMTLACNLQGGSMLLEKYGAGTVVLEGSNTYGQATRVFEGVLLVNGRNVGGSPLSAQPGGVLGGTGHIVPLSTAYVTIKAGGTLAPGAGGETGAVLTIGSADSPNELRMEGGCLSVAVGLATHDRVTVYGNLNLWTASASTVAVAVKDEAVWQARRGEEIPLLTWTGDKIGTGTLSAATPLPTGWKLRERPGMLYMSYASPGTVIGVR
jgi:autotransporter-associated beta strand protein